MLVSGRRPFVMALLVLAASGCAAPAGPVDAPMDAPGATSNAPAATAPPAESPASPEEGVGPGPLPAGTAATVSVRGEAYAFPETATSTCIVAPTLVSVTAATSDPRLVLTITWRAAGTRHLNFGAPVGRLGVWQAGDEVEGASDVSFEVNGRSAEFNGPMRHTDESIDEVTIRVSC